MVAFSSLWSICESVDLDQARRHLERLAAARTLPGSFTAGDQHFGFGFETRRDPRSYHWDGLRRGGDPRRPTLLVQVSLAGWGLHQAGPEREGQRPQRVAVGHAFAALIPSAHRYWLPPESPGWTFFWCILNHAWVVERMAGALRLSARPVFPLAVEDPLFAALLRLWEGAAREQLGDPWAAELAQIDVALAFARHHHQLRYPDQERSAELEELRRRLAERPGRPLEVAELARSAGMTRSAWAHRFKARTGLSPARCILQLRLEELRRRLAAGDEPLSELAAACGFADANHLCKVFRRHQHQSPGQFRRQMRG